MSAHTITLQEYEQAERVLAHEDADRGLIAHVVVTVLVSALLIAINFTLADEFPWSAFAVGGMTIGMLAHWWFGYRNLEADLTARQHKVEERAAHLR
jgi:hypothetical protein